ncbi:MAG: metallophosphoesterase family protein [Deltaproteobacteria bacterium]|jgi:Icc-related predicted phosphoesterase|nr:metallophosphoesterase family protein [Deltaproteobacteria bacterium]
MTALSASHPYWLVIGDLHDQLDRLPEIPELANARGILVSGDLTVTGGIDQASAVMNRLWTYSGEALAQFGNMDRPEIAEWLREQACNLHDEVRKLAPNVALMGVGASIFTPFGTPSEYPESWFAEKLEQMWRTARNCEHVILISHNPPVNSRCDLLENGAHVGSTAVREFIEEAQPALCFCGHIHEARGVDRIGRTVVINTGPLSAGGYGLLRLNPQAGNAPEGMFLQLPG